MPRSRCCWCSPQPEVPHDRSDRRRREGLIRGAGGASEAPEDRRCRLVRPPHHDGSPTYLPNPPQRARRRSSTCFLRVPHGSRRQPGGGPAGARRRAGQRPRPAGPDRRLGQPLVPGDVAPGQPGHALPVPDRRRADRLPWITAAGPRLHDPTDAGDFVSTLDPGGPAWLPHAIAYQIFPDRFARSGRSESPRRRGPCRGRGRRCRSRPAGRALRCSIGGDLPGVTAHLDHIASLGANLLYLTPVFPAPSNHRYNASTFDRVDPLLGGDEAYRRAHRRGSSAGHADHRRPDDQPHRHRARVVHGGGRRRCRTRRPASTTSPITRATGSAGWGTGRFRSSTTPTQRSCGAW